MATRWDVERAVRESDLPSPARHLVHVLLTWADPDTATIPARFSPSLSTLAKATGMGRSTVAEHLGRLEEAGWVSRRRRDGATTAYRLQVPSTSPGGGLVQELDGSTSPGAGRGESGSWTGGVQEPDGTSPAPGPIHTSTVQPSSRAHARTPAAVVIESTGATDDEANTIIELIQTRHRPRRLRGYVHHLAQSGDLQVLLDEVRGAAAPAPLPPPCGDCDERRQIELDDGRMARCPACHPLRAAAGGEP